VAYYVGRALQLLAMIQLGYALYTGFALDNQKRELWQLAVAVALFLAGRLIERRYARA
jgi:hypothetical protein